MNKWVMDYREKQWKTYEVRLDSALYSDFFERLPEVPGHELIVCGSESQWADKIKFDEKRFYPDLELLAADLDPDLGVLHIQRLDQDWQGHKAGALVMCLPTGVAKQPITFTFAVEVN